MSNLSGKFYLCYCMCTKGISLEVLKHAGVNPNDGQNCRSTTIKICVDTQGWAGRFPHFPLPSEGCGKPRGEAALALVQHSGRQQLRRASVATCSVKTSSSGMLTPNTGSPHGARVPKSFSHPTKASPCSTTDICPKGSSL